MNETKHEQRECAVLGLNPRISLRKLVVFSQRRPRVAQWAASRSRWQSQLRERNR